MVSLTSPSHERREKTHRLPAHLPRSRDVLFTLGTGDIETWDQASVAVFSDDHGGYKTLIEGGSNPRYSRSGHLPYARDGALLAVAFDRDALEIRGTPVTIVDDLATYPIYGHAEFALSDDGTLVYARGGASGDTNRVLWIDRTGYVEPLVERELAYAEVALSPDERSLALVIEGANPGIWIYDIGRETLTPLASGFDNDEVIWTPDGTSVTFESNRTGSYQIYQQQIGVGLEAELLVESPDAVWPGSWSPDARNLAYVKSGPASPPDVWLLTLGEATENKPLVDHDYWALRPRISPDGAWITFETFESGRPEVYLQTFPEAGRKWQVSPGGGGFAEWARDGSEIFYRDGDALFAVAFDARREPPLGQPTLLFERPRLANFYDVASDGRFLFVEAIATPPPTELVLVQNFFAELERLVPTGR